jgi:hypothetical protein
MGTCYVNVVCLVFKAVVIVFPILGGLFHVYRWIVRNFNGNFLLFKKTSILVRSCVPSSFLKEHFELLKLILWCSNNQTYHLDFIRDS